MSRTALAAVLLLASSGAVLANDFSGNLAFPAPSATAQTTSAPLAGLDRTATGSIVRTAKSSPQTPAKSQTAQPSGEGRLFPAFD